jgi:hypothetical protein
MAAAGLADRRLLNADAFVQPGAVLLQACQLHPGAVPGPVTDWRPLSSLAALSAWVLTSSASESDRPANHKTVTVPATLTVMDPLTQIRDDRSTAAQSNRRQPFHHPFRAVRQALHNVLSSVWRWFSACAPLGCADTLAAWPWTWWRIDPQLYLTAQASAWAARLLPPCSLGCGQILESATPAKNRPQSPQGMHCPTADPKAVRAAPAALYIDTLARAHGRRPRTGRSACAWTSPH